jgi:hypothetical protein
MTRLTLPGARACLRRSRPAQERSGSLRRFIVGERAAELLKVRHQTQHELDSEFSVHGDDRPLQFEGGQCDH